MIWRDHWPGEPFEAEEGNIGDDTEPFTVALKRSACKASSGIVALHEEWAEEITDESKKAAARALLDDIDFPGSSFKGQHQTTPGT